MIGAYDCITVVDANGDPILDDGNEITASQTITAKAGFFQRLINFIKNLFRLNRIIFQAFKYN